MLKQNEWISITSYHRGDIYFHRSPFLAAGQPNYAGNQDSVYIGWKYLSKTIFCFPDMLTENCDRLFFFTVNSAANYQFRSETIC